MSNFGTLNLFVDTNDVTKVFTSFLPEISTVVNKNTLQISALRNATEIENAE